MPGILVAERNDKMEQWLTEKKRIVLAALVLIQLFSALFCFKGMAGEKEICGVGDRTLRLYGGESPAEGVYHIDQDTALPDKVFLSMELPDLEKGVYEVRIEYDADSEQISRVSSGQAGYRKLRENTVSLRPSNIQKEVSYRFMLWEKVDDLKAEILYTGEGALTVTDFQVVHTRQDSSSRGAGGPPSEVS